MAGDTDTDRVFWMALRRALLIIVGAIDERYGVDKDRRRRKTTT